MDIVIYVIGGFLAGIATGMVGLSAAVIIAPLFATLVGMDPYVAIGIALASDVFASSTSAVNYIRYKNIHIKKSLPLAISVILFTILGSILSRDMNPYNLNSTINIFVVILGLRFLIYPVTSSGTQRLIKLNRWNVLQSIIWGAVIGMISGYFGSGGGLSMLAVLTMLLGYGLRSAVGTSVFIMAFTAFVGATTHIVIAGTLWVPLVVASIFAFIGANFASIYANKIKETLLNRIIGIFLILYGAFLVIIYYI